MMSVSRDISAQENVARGAGTTFSFLVVSTLLVWLFRVLLARAYTVSEFGAYSLLDTLLRFFVLIAGFGLVNSISRYLPWYKARGGSLGGNYLFFVCGVPLLVSVLMSSLLWWNREALRLFLSQPTRFNDLLVFIVLAIPLAVLTNIVRNIFLAEKRYFYRNFSYHIVEKIVLIIGVLIGFWKGLDMVFMAFILFLSVFIALVVDLFLIAKIDLGVGYKKGSWPIREWLLFSLPLLLSGFFAMVLNWSDNLIIARYLDNTNLGLYSASYSLALLVSFFYRVISQLFIAQVSEQASLKKNKAVKEIFSDVTRWIFGLTFPVAVVLILWSRFFIRAVFGESFIGGRTALVIVVSGIVVSSLLSLSSNVLVAYGRTVMIFVVNLIVALINIFLSISLVGIWGINGVAFSTALSLIMQSVCFYFLTRRIYGVGLDVSGIRRHAFAVGVAGTTGLIVLKGDDLMRSLLSLVGFVIIYLFMVKKAGVWNKKDVEVGKRVFKSIKDALIVKSVF